MTEPQHEANVLPCTVHEATNEVHIFYLDTTYPFDGDEETASDALKARLEAYYSRSLLYSDVYPGASGPAFAIIENLAAFAVPATLLATFFSGKRIKENIEAWSSMFRHLRGLTHHKSVVSRNGAAIIAMNAVFDRVGGLPCVCKLNGYCYFDARGALDNVQDHPLLLESAFDQIDDAPATEYLSATDHGFDIEVDGRMFRIIVRETDAVVIDEIFPDG